MNLEQLQKIEYILSVTEPEDMVYDGNAGFNVFRKDIDYFWFSLKKDRALKTYQTMTDYKYDIYKSIQKFKPKVISTHCIENINDRRIADYYVQSSQFDDLYIRNNNTRTE